MSTSENDNRAKPKIVITNSSNRPLYIALISCIVIIVLIVVIIIFDGIYQKNRPTGNCTKDIKSTACQELKAAIPDLPPNKVKALGVQVAKIKKLPNYKKDVNLQYVILTYDINLSNAPAASKDYNQLKKDYTPKDGYDPLLKPYAQSPGQIVGVVSALQNQATTPLFYVTGVSK